MVVQMFHDNLLSLLDVIGWGKVLSKKQSAWVYFQDFGPGDYFWSFLLFFCGGRFILHLLISGELLLELV